MPQTCDHSFTRYFRAAMGNPLIPWPRHRVHSSASYFITGSPQLPCSTLGEQNG